MEDKDISDLINEKRLLFKRLNEIDKILELKKRNRLQIPIEEIALLVKNLTGVEVKDIGKKCKKESKIAKQLFWRAGFNESIPGNLLSAYTGDKSRTASFAGREYHKNNCKFDSSLRVQWNELKKLIIKNKS